MSGVGRGQTPAQNRKLRPEAGLLKSGGSTGVSRAAALGQGTSTQGVLSFFRSDFFFLAPLWNKLGLLTTDSLDLFRGRVDCGDLPEIPFLASTF